MTYTLKQKPEDFIVQETMSIDTSDNGQYAVLRVTLTNYNTEDAIEHIASKTRTNRSLYGVAGYKDRAAVTTQYVSVRNQPLERFDIDMKDIEIEPVGYADSPISLGDHTTNTFIITLRDVEREPQHVETVINYFDSQRFSTSNHIIGKHLVKDQYEEAATLLLQDAGHRPKIQQHLDKHPNDYITALKQLPNGLLKLFVHAYQSQLWNRGVQRLDRIPEEYPLMGFATRPDPSITKSVDRVLEEENLTQRDFIIKSIPFLTTEGTTRKTSIDISDLSIENVRDTVYKCSFTLPPGAYATMVVKHIMEDVEIIT